MFHVEHLGFLRRIGRLLLGKIIDKLFSLGGTNHRLNLFDRSRAKTFHALELLEQFLLGLRTNARNVVERRMRLRLATLLPMERDGKAVHLVLDMFEQMEQRVRADGTTNFPA